MKIILKFKFKIEINGTVIKVFLKKIVMAVIIKIIVDFIFRLMIL